MTTGYDCTPEGTAVTVRHNGTVTHYTREEWDAKHQPKPMANYQQWLTSNRQSLYQGYSGVPSELDDDGNESKMMTFEEFCEQQYRYAG
jgi:hypothetical protein